MVIAVFCKSHPSHVIIVLKRHTRHPMPQEVAHMEVVAHNHFPNKKWKTSEQKSSIPEHFHLHEL